MTQNRNNDVLSFKKLVSAIDKCAQNRVAHYSNKRLAYKLPIKYFSSNQICMNGKPQLVEQISVIFIISRLTVILF